MRPASVRMLDELGLAIGPDGARLVDENAASRHIHHSRVPVALVGYALTAPDLARETFPKFSFVNLIQKAPSLDMLESEALAALCGVQEDRTWMRDSATFGQQVWAVVERYDLGAFFERVDRPYGTGGDHYSMRPRGVHWHTSDPIPDEIKQWRAAYKAATPLRQLMTATVLRLYNQTEDKIWMVRVKKDWHAAEGIEILRGECALKDWGRLYALYSGW